MTSTATMFQHAVSNTRWLFEQQLDVLLTYIEHQQSNDVFFDYLAKESDENGSTFEQIASAAQWSPECQVDVLLTYIERQQSNDVFFDYLAEEAWKATRIK